MKKILLLILFASFLYSQEIFPSKELRFGHTDWTNSWWLKYDTGIHFYNYNGTDSLNIFGKYGYFNRIYSASTAYMLSNLLVTGYGYFTGGIRTLQDLQIMGTLDITNNQSGNDIYKIGLWGGSDAGTSHGGGITVFSNGYNSADSGKVVVTLGNTSTADFEVGGSIQMSGAANALYFGDPTTEGSWRIIRSGNNIVHQRLESSTWVTKQTITP